MIEHNFTFGINYTKKYGTHEIVLEGCGIYCEGTSGGSTPTPTPTPTPTLTPIPGGTELLQNPGFESGTDSWTAMGGYIAADSTNKRTGTNGCKAYSRSHTYDGPQQDVILVLSTNGQGNYDISAWVKMGTGADSVQVVVRTTDSSGIHYFSPSAVSVSSSGWTQISGTVNITWSGSLTAAYFYVETKNTTNDMYVDDCSLQKTGGSAPSNTITVSANTISIFSEGFGWNSTLSQDHGWPETFGVLSTQRPDYGDHVYTESDWDKFFDLMSWTGTDFVRHAFLISDLEPYNDDSDPNNINWVNLTTNSTAMQRHYRVLDELKARGIKVFLCNWAQSADWLFPQNASLPSSNAEFAEAMAEFVYYLKVTRGYENIYGLSIWNEPNAMDGYGNTLRSGFLDLYSSVRSRLNSLGLNSIKIIGADTASSDPTFLNSYLNSYAGYWDQLSNHDYGSWNGDAVGNWSSFVNNINANYGGKPVIVGEYGNFGAGSGQVNDDAQVYTGSISCANLVVRYLNAGVKGFAEWEYCIYGDTYKNFGALTACDSSYVFKVYNPKYWTRSVLGRYVRARWQVKGVNEDVTGTGNVRCTVLRSPDDSNTTVLIVNSSGTGYTLGIDMSALPYKPSSLSNLYVTGSIPTGITQGSTVTLSNGIGSVYVNPQSVVALTTMTVGDLNEPNTMKVPW